MFKDCIKLKEKPLIDKWEVKEVCQVNNVFEGCGFQVK